MFYYLLPSNRFIPFVDEPIREFEPTEIETLERIADVMEWPVVECRPRIRTIMSAVAAIIGPVVDSLPVFGEKLLPEVPSDLSEGPRTPPTPPGEFVQANAALG